MMRIKRSLTGCDHSESHLTENGIDVFTLNGQIKGKFVSKNVVNLSRWKFTKVEISLLSEGLEFVPNSNHINKYKLKMELEALVHELIPIFGFPRGTIKHNVDFL